MNLSHRLSLLVQRSHSLPAILDNAVRIIAEEMRMDVCSIYLLDPTDWRLRLSAFRLVWRWPAVTPAAA